MSIKILSFSLTILISSNYIFADIHEAKELFDNAKCMSCHNNEDFLEKTRKAKDFLKVHQKVSICAHNNSVEWFDDETMDVTKYLNQKFYNYKKIIK